MKKIHWLLKSFFVGATVSPLLLWLAIELVNRVTTPATPGTVVIITDPLIDLTLPSGGMLTLTGWRLLLFVVINGGVLFCSVAAVGRLLKSWVP